MDNYQKYIALSRYARYLEEEGRRETWEETVDRYINFWKARVDESLHKDLTLLLLSSFRTQFCFLTEQTNLSFVYKAQFSSFC